MRILVVGAGGIGGYFGGRLAEAGRDVTFLVRPGRAAQLAADGLVVRSPRGDIDIARPAFVTADGLGGGFDLVLLSCKAYDLESAMDAFAPAMGAGTLVLPLLNGMAHLGVLDARFGVERVLGGQCQIAATLERGGVVRQLAPMHALTFGARGAVAGSMEAVTAALEGAGFDGRASDTILQDMWEKWVFLCTLAAGTCLMRGSVGDIVAAGGEGVMLELFGECRAVAEAAGFAPREAWLGRSTEMLTKAGSVFTASMLRDVESGGRTEAEHVVGDMVARHPGDVVLLTLALVHLRTYAARRVREG